MLGALINVIVSSYIFFVPADILKCIVRCKNKMYGMVIHIVKAVANNDKLTEKDVYHLILTCDQAYCVIRISSTPKLCSN